MQDRSGERAMMVVTFDDRELCIEGSWLRLHDISPDGQRFYAMRTMTAATLPPVTHINVIQNWFEELKEKVPGKYPAAHLAP